MPGLLSYDYGDAANDKIHIRKDGTWFPTPYNIKIGELGWTNKAGYGDIFVPMGLTDRERHDLELLREMPHELFKFTILDYAGGDVSILASFPMSNPGSNLACAASLGETVAFYIGNDTLNPIYWAPALGGIAPTFSEDSQVVCLIVNFPQPHEDQNTPLEVAVQPFDF